LTFGAFRFTNVDRKPVSNIFAQLLYHERLYKAGRLVHGDLSEYNIMVVPASFVENRASGVEDSDDELQAVLIDFGQAVDTRHPSAIELLERDLQRVLSFFSRQGVETMSKDEAFASLLDEVE